MKTRDELFLVSLTIPTILSKEVSDTPGGAIHVWLMCLLEQLDLIPAKKDTFWGFSCGVFMGGNSVDNNSTFLKAKTATRPSLPTLNIIMYRRRPVNVPKISGSFSRKSGIRESQSKAERTRACDRHFAYVWVGAFRG